MLLQAAAKLRIGKFLQNATFLPVPVVLGASICGDFARRVCFCVKLLPSILPFLFVQADGSNAACCAKEHNFLRGKTDFCLQTLLFLKNGLLGGHMTQINFGPQQIHTGPFEPQ